MKIESLSKTCMCSSVIVNYQKLEKEPNASLLAKGETHSMNPRYGTLLDNKKE
jgi:hypothetical protein